MNIISEIEKMTDDNISDDLWSDHLIFTAENLFRDNYSLSIEDFFIENMKKYSMNQQRRIIEVMLSKKNFERFDDYIKKFSNLDLEVAETVFDLLRDWELDSTQKNELKEFILKYPNRSDLINYIIAKEYHV